MARVRDALRWIVWGTKVVVSGAANLASVFRGGGLGEALEPWMRFGAASEIPYGKLAADGVKAVLFDLENTLIPPGGPFTPEGREVVSAVRSAGLRVAVVSNASAAWVWEELGKEDIPYVAPAGKPGPDGFRRACSLVGVEPQDAVYVGDQLITDVLGAQRAGLRAILVPPRYDREGRSARFQRRLSRVLVRVARSRDERMKA